MFKKINFLFITLFIVGLLTACSNFLGSEELLQTLETTIEYVNSPSITVRILGNEKAIKFISGSGDITLKKTDKRTLEFELNSTEYKFVKWNIYKLGEEETDCSSNVKLTTTNSGNTYKTELEVLSDSDSIVLTPECYLLPTVTDISPKYYPSGVSCYQGIVITFSQPMKASELNDFTNITISGAGNTSLNEYFNTPLLSEDGKTLKITPISATIKNLLQNVEVYDITIQLRAGIHENKEKPEELQAYSYTYRINLQQDNSDPVLQDSDITIERQIKNLETNELYRTVLDNTNFESWSNENDGYNSHHISDTIYITCKGSDIGSGVKALLIKETQKKLVDASDATDEYEEKEYGTFIQLDETNFKTNTFEYKLRAERDGIVQLDFTIIDYDNRRSDTKTYYVIRDTAFVNNISIISSQDTNNWDNAYLRIPNEEGKDILNKDTFKVRCSDEFYNGHYTKCKIITTYWDEYNDIRPLFSATGNNSKSTYYTTEEKIILNPKNKAYIRITAENEMGEYIEKTFQVPAGCDIGYYSFSYYDDTNTTREIDFPSLLNSNSVYYLYQIKTSLNASYGDISKIQTSNVNGYYLKLNPSTYYKIYKVEGQRFDSSYNNGFYSCALNPIEFYVNGSNEVKKIDNTPYSSTWPSFTLSVDPSVPNSNGHTVHVKFINNGDPNHIYKFFYYHTVGTKTYKYYPSSTDSFIVPCGYTYYTGISQHDKNGLYINERTSTQYPQIDASEINDEPYTKYTLFGGVDAMYSSAPNMFYIYSYGASGYGLKTNTTYNINYYIEKNGNINAKAPEFSEEKITNLTENSLAITTGASLPYIDYYYHDFENSLYTIYFKITDEYGNYGTGSSIISNLLKDESLDYKNIIYTNTELVIPVPSEMYGMTLFYLDNNKWKKAIYNSGGDKDYKYSKNSLNYRYTLTHTNTKDNFIKISSYSQYLNGYNRYYKTLYIHPKHFSSNTQLKKKNMIEGRNGYQIYCDDYTLVRTLYSKTNWGEDADMWASRGLENDVTVEQSDFTYSPITTGIPTGNYYCTVVNFADGSSCMSEVKQK